MPSLAAQSLCQKASLGRDRGSAGRKAVIASSPSEGGLLESDPLGSSEQRKDSCMYSTSLQLAVVRVPRETSWSFPMAHSLHLDSKLA